MASVTVEIADELLHALGESDEARSRFVLETLACECYRSERLTQAESARLAKLPRAQFVDLLMRREVPDPATGKEMSEGYRAIKKLFPR